ncbi:MAG: FAD-dependent oxidoreductase, partial [Meiothermus sp.]|nr:FAD-dependent oxidoreductase [Meiothermus sp.]
MTKIAVVGGGLAGLAAAYWATEAGLEVWLLEASQSFGGQARTLSPEAILLEPGEEFFDDTPDTLLKLCAQLGLEPQPLPGIQRVVQQAGRDWVLPPGLNLASGYALHKVGEMPFGPSVRWRLGIERFAAPGAVKDELLGAFFRRRLGSEVWEVLEPYLSATLGGPAEEVSAPAALGRLVALERQGGLLNGSRRLTTEGRWHLLGGMGSLVEALRSRLMPKARLLPNHSVWALTPSPGGWQVHVRGGQLEVGAVLLALPAPQAARVFRPSAPQMTTLLNQFPHQHSAKVYLLYRQAELAAGPSEFFFAQGEGYTSRALKLTYPKEGVALARVQFAGEVARSGDSELSRLAVQDLSKRLQTRARPLAAWVFRQPFSRPQFTQGQARRVTDLERLLVHAPGLFLTGSYLAG